METQRSTHPLIITAAVAVILASGVGIASMTGMLPSSNALPAPEVAQVEGSTTATGTPALTAQTPVEPKPASKPAASRSNDVVAAAPKAKPAATVCNSCGEVTAVRERKIEGDGSGAGAVAGGVAGAVLGKQLGNGNGQKAMAVLGAVGGAYAGNKIEKQVRATVVYDVDVSLNSGDSRTFTFNDPPSWQRGDQIKVVDGKLRTRS
ncbi:MAG: glycine zipper 2TM domain-containing protein [Limnobacter sp.]|nr:glycine zipper 2TM domain-containing protein [Limnobacter sp.]